VFVSGKQTHPSLAFCKSLLLEWCSTRVGYHKAKLSRLDATNTLAYYSKVNIYSKLSFITFISIFIFLSLSKNERTEKGSKAEAAKK
jgi:hypothetical protein